jgi:4-diphosphocytidyl-2-C-methyl-D-erythritol kinase
LLKLPSFAKINWMLRIFGRRPDGYHEVATMLQSISLCDELTFELRQDREISLTCDDPQIPVDDSNLIVRAAKALQKSAGVNITLSKKIPAKGGLGGGSSNAAVTLLALNRLWDLQLENPDLLRTGATLGADVPFFLLGGCAEARGIGTDLCSLADVEQKALIVVTPNAAVSTATAYAALNSGSLTTSESASNISNSISSPRFGGSLRWAFDKDFFFVIVWF